MTLNTGSARSADRFLLGIVLGMVALVGVAFAVVLLRPQPTYQPDGTPEASAHNYLLALRQEDEARAYGYLSPRLAGYPASIEAFATAVRNEIWELRSDRSSVALSVVETRVVGDTAWVTVKQTWFDSGGVFSQGISSSTFDIRLEHAESGTAWLIVEAGQYWAACWELVAGC